MENDNLSTIKPSNDSASSNKWPIAIFFWVIALFIFAMGYLVAHQFQALHPDAAQIGYSRGLAEDQLFYYYDLVDIGLIISITVASILTLRALNMGAKALKFLLGGLLALSLALTVGLMLLLHFFLFISLLPVPFVIVCFFGLITPSEKVTRSICYIVAVLLGLAICAVAISYLMAPTIQPLIQG